MPGFHAEVMGVASRVCGRHGSAGPRCAGMAVVEDHSANGEQIGKGLEGLVVTGAAEHAAGGGQGSCGHQRGGARQGLPH